MANEICAQPAIVSVGGWGDLTQGETDLGRVAACPELADCFVQGDIRKERFCDVWDNRYQVFRDRSWTKRGDCAACDAFGACQGGSLHLYPSLESEPARCFYLMLNWDGESPDAQG